MGAGTVQRPSNPDPTVTAEANPLVDVYKTDSSTNIVPEQIESLPVPDRDFQRRSSRVRLSRASLAGVVEDVVAVAMAEGFRGHAQSVLTRFEGAE